MFKRLLAVSAAMLLTLAGAVIAAELREDHPTTYVVKKGDTLWDIAGRFLKKPWLWPEIWQANPQIRNPHLIYPGDVLSLVYIDGEPRVQAEGPRIGEAVPTIPLADVEAFLKQFTVVPDARALPHVVGMEDDRLLSSAGQLVYVRNLQGAQPGMVVDIARPVNKLGGGKGKHPPGISPLDQDGRRFHTHWAVPRGFGEATGEHLGDELAIHATGEVTRVQGEVAVVLLRDEGREIRVGDRVLPSEAQPYDLHFYPRAPDSIPDKAQVMAVADGMQAGPRLVVALNVGARDGIRNGHVFSIWHGGAKRPDHIANTNRMAGNADRVQTPDDYVGRLMVFRTFDKVSYALVMEGIRPVHTGDKLKHPDATE
ncbi:LysM peptidoglycan-binding domain-containing protein [Arenimonas fontis]|uniref:LysM peptidoglycan-binding domain-containing protein n=1 Tax=Arenimonas fontis TaxID=2608255 RepID=A0A5B2ZBS3_9GAMM|nr:LysM domain-containing protein [Arenimonas fontis]KAA2284634.1 LysM peptidoglycan-binding domain-containing protein [Arenimonas fontis]